MRAAGTSILILGMAAGLGLLAHSGESAAPSGLAGFSTAGQVVMAAQAVGAAEMLRIRDAIDPGLMDRAQAMGARVDSLELPFLGALRDEARIEALRGEWTQRDVAGYLDAADLPFEEVHRLVLAANQADLRPDDSGRMWKISAEVLCKLAPVNSQLIDGAAALARMEIGTVESVTARPLDSGEWIANGRDWGHVPVLAGAGRAGLTSLAETLALPAIPLEPLVEAALLTGKSATSHSISDPFSLGTAWSPSEEEVEDKVEDQIAYFAF